MNYFCFDVQHNRPFILCILWDSLSNTKIKKKYFCKFPLHQNRSLFDLIKNRRRKKWNKIDSPQFQHYSYKAIDYSSIDCLLTNHNLNVTSLDRHRAVCANYSHDRNCYLLLNPNNGFASQMLLRNMFAMASLILCAEHLWHV